MDLFKIKKMKTKTLQFNGFLALMILLIFNSCGSIGSIDKSVPYGKIITEGVEITAEDGSFTLRSNEVWTPPFQNDTEGTGLNSAKTDMVGFYKDALEHGAKKVRVKVPYQTEPLYGVLLLGKVYSGVSLAVTRSYQISIPVSYVEAAQNGKVSVLYEYYDVKKKSPSKILKYAALGAAGALIKSPDENNPKTWVLWLSDIPFSL